MESRTPWDSDKTWRGKAKRIIHKQCEQSYRQANPLPRKKHKPYHVRSSSTHPIPTHLGLPLG